MTTSIAAESPSTTLWSQVHRIIWWVKFLFVSAGSLFFLVLLAETFRLYSSASEVHPILGHAILLLMAAVGLLVAIPAYRIFQVPRAVSPPALPRREDITLDHLRREVRYLERYLACCARNPELLEKKAETAEASQQLTVLAGKVRGSSESDLEEISNELRDWTAATALKILKDVDKKAERLIYQEALRVGLGTAASPNGMLDAFVMLWRSVQLMSRLSVLYYGRPGLWGMLTISKDIAGATVAAAYLQNVTDSLGGLLARSVGGFTGVVAGPAVDGVTNALVLVRIGYLTKERCRSSRKWDTDTQKSALSNALAATQKVAVGLTGEIFRQVGSGIGRVVDAAASGVSHVAGKTTENLAAAAESAMKAATDLGQKISDFFQVKDPSPPPTADDESHG